MMQIAKTVGLTSRLKLIQPLSVVQSQCDVHTVPGRVLEKARRSKLGQAVRGAGVEDPSTYKKKEYKPRSPEEQAKYIDSIRDYKYIYPDFLPNPIYYFRDTIKEKIEREDMIERRKNINIPEFYVGSIMAVSVSDSYAPGKQNRFVGICIRRDNYQLRHTFTLRNVVDRHGVEIQYDLYNPTIQQIDVLKLEKRLDDNLTYLQDCPLEYSTFSFSMPKEKTLPGFTVPLNTIKVPLNPKPWRHKWDRKDLKGVIYPKMKRYEYEQIIHSNNDHKPFERYDVMKHYRESIHDDDQEEIVEEIKKMESVLEAKKEVVMAAKKFARVRVIPSESK